MEKKQSDLQKMFMVLRAIEREDLDNTNFSTVDVADDEILDTACYFKTKDAKILSSGLYIIVWADDNINRYKFPEPDFTLELEESDEYIMGYQFENK